MPTRQEYFSPANAFIQGRAARQQQDYGNTRNAMAQMELENAPREMQARNKLLDTQVQGAQQQIDATKAKEGYTRLSQALSSGNPKQYVLQREPEFVAKALQHGFDIANSDDQKAAEIIQGFAQQYAGAAGIAPAQPDPRLQLEQQKLQQGASQFDQRLAFDREKLAAERGKPNAQFVALTPEEIKQAGLPPGTSAQRDTATGKIDILTKRDNTGALSQKDATTAKIKLTTIQMARKQLESAKKAFEEGRQGMNAFGPGQGMLPTQAGKKFDAAINQMRGTWTSLKRVPGVGSMSDYESKMDASQFPGRNDYESVIEQKLQGMEDQLALLENGYTGLLGGGTSQEQPQAPEAAPQSQGIDERGYASLPSGTQYRAPDGTIRTKR